MTSNASMTIVVEGPAEWLDMVAEIQASVQAVREYNRDLEQENADLKGSMAKLVLLYHDAHGGLWDEDCMICEEIPE